jgi:hypothetical protein
MNLCIEAIRNDPNIPIGQKTLIDKALPKPFCFNKKKVKAIVMGADPSNFSNHGSTVFLDFVFGIGSDDSRYFRDILKNLNQVGLHLEHIYVQNLVRNYMPDETGKSKHWEIFADKWVDGLKVELHGIDKKREIPVLVTAERIMKFLVVDGYQLLRARSIYDCSVNPIPSGMNKLGRPLIPLYRHQDYQLEKRDKYRTSLKDLLNE